MKIKGWKVTLCLTLCLVLALCSLNVMAAEETVRTVVERTELPALETSSYRTSWFTLDGAGNVALKDGNYTQWIDRVDLTDGEYAASLYAWMEDNCGENGALVDPTVAEQLSSGEYVYLVTEIDGTGTFSYTGNSSVDDEAAFYAVYDDLIANENVAFSYITAAYSAFDRDHPEVFWLSGQCQMLDLLAYGYDANGRISYTQYLYFLLQSDDFDIRAEKYWNADSLRTAISTLSDTVDGILEGVDARANRYEKVKYFNDWLTHHNCYNSSLNTATHDAFECISALRGSTGKEAPVCEGYARAMMVLCRQADVPCVLVDGNAIVGTTTEPHMWNYVQMEDGNWYGVDATWNDPVSGGTAKPVSGYENEKYLLVGSDTKIGSMSFIVSHPACNMVTLNGTSFINGPQLSKEAYDPATAPVPVVVPTLTGSGFSLSFESEILVNFYYTVSDPTDVVEQGMLVFYDDPGDADYAKANDVYAGSASNNGVYLSTTKGIAAKYMGDSRYYCAYAKLSDGTFAYSKLYQYSPKKYATNMLSKASTSAEQKALCVAMLNYGAAAQNYFGYNTDDLMNASLTADQQALVVDYDKTLFKGAIAADTAKTGNFPKNAEAFVSRSATVSFEGAFAINYYFAPSASITGDLTLYYWTPEAYAAAEVLTVQNASGSTVMVTGGDGSYWGQVSGIAAKMLDETYYVAGVYTDASGNTYCTGVIAYSLSRYCLNNAKDGNSMQELAANTAMYGYYATAYFNK